MITLSNGHKGEYFIGSGALGFDGLGWFWERILVWLGLIKPELFIIRLKSLSRKPIKGNLKWLNPLTWLPWSPWSCVRFVPGGSVNRVGLTNPGFDYWCAYIMPKIDFKKYRVIVSLYGTAKELVYMVKKLEGLPLVAIELNVSCPNTGHAMDEAVEVIQTVKIVKTVSRHPIILKLSVAQEYIFIAQELVDVIEAIDFNSVPWHIAVKMLSWKYKDGKSPLWRLEKKLGGGGGGGVSGEPAQYFNWTAMEKIKREVPNMPVIASSIMKHDDMIKARVFGANAVSFGAIHLRTPWKPTSIVRKELGHWKM